MKCASFHNFGHFLQVMRAKEIKVMTITVLLLVSLLTTDKSYCCRLLVLGVSLLGSHLVPKVIIEVPGLSTLTIPFTLGSRAAVRIHSDFDFLNL